MTILSNTKYQLAIAVALAALMATTRFHHFGSAISLPDASQAIFFLAGFYLKPVFFLAFLVEAALIDYAAISNGVSGWCVTPAYPFLIATYASLWVAGRWYARRYHHVWGTLVPLASALLIGTSVAFLISNSSFYLLSGYFADMSLSGYAARVVQYFPPYVIHTFAYVMLAAFAHGLIAAVRNRKKAVSLNAQR